MPPMPAELKMRLISALWEWAEAEGQITYIHVHADDGTVLPKSFVVNDQIVLNIAEEATHQLLFGERVLSFQGRFGGKITSVVIPAERIGAAYIKDTAIGLVFPVADSPATDDETSSVPANPAPTSTTAFRILGKTPASSLAASIVPPNATTTEPPNSPNSEPTTPASPKNTKPPHTPTFTKVK